MVSLRTRRYREAEHLAALADRGFGREWKRLVVSKKRVSVYELKCIMRDYLRDLLDKDTQHRATRPPEIPLYTTDEGLRELREDGEVRGYPDCQDLSTVWHADMLMIAREKEIYDDLVGDRSFDLLKTEAEEILELRGYDKRDWLMTAVAYAEMMLSYFKTLKGRTDGTLPVFTFAEGPDAPQPSPPAPATAVTAPVQKARERLKASSFVEDHFAARIDEKANLHSLKQERDTVRLFLEICGDRPFADYNRSDVTDFLATLRRLPVHRGRSPTDKALSAAEIIAQADVNNAQRIKEHTVKRHLSALKQLFRFARDRSQTTQAHLDETLADQGFKRGARIGAREQREQWTSDELVQLFASPWWSGRKSRVKHTQPGDLIERDSKFWLPLLALFHGARLEELADLYSRDIKRDVESGIWAINIQESEGNPGSGKRTLKNHAAKRVIPLHPEIVRLGFLDYVRKSAPHANDPLFPELKPQGVDNRRGARFTRDFAYYRQRIGLYQEGKGMHSFRHTVETRLMDEAQTEQHRRHIRFILGHSGPGDEGSQRYDKGPGLKAKAETLALLRYPELDLSHLYIDNS